MQRLAKLWRLSILLLLAASGISFAQTRERHPVTLSTHAAIEALGSTDRSERRRARQEIERHPGAFAPPVFPALGEALIDEGQTDGALRWWYFGYIRALTEALAITHGRDGMYRGGALEVALFTYGRTAGPRLRSALREPPSNIEQLLDEAIALDARTPRYYSLNWYAEESLSRVWNDENPTWDSGEARWREHLADARAEVLNLTVAQVSAESEARREADRSEAEVASGNIASEATEMIQSNWRERVRPIRSMRLPCDQGTPLATPIGANVEAFAVVCGSGQFADRVVWLDANTGDVIGDAPFRAGNVDDARVLVRNGHAFVPDMRSRRGQLQMIDVSGAIDLYRPVDWTQPELAIADISPSGRFVALRGSAEDVSTIALVDLDEGRIVWERDGFNREYRMTMSQTENFAFLWEQRGRVVPVLLRRNGCRDTRCTESALVLVDVEHSSERVIALPRPMARNARLYGDENAIVYFDAEGVERPPVVAAVVSLGSENQLQLVRYQEQRPMPTARALCGTREIVTGPSAARFAAIASLAAGSFEIAAPARSSLWPDCAISASGERLLVVARPFAHLYSIQPE
jgi:hypothetical protein